MLNKTLSNIYLCIICLLVYPHGQLMALDDGLLDVAIKVNTSSHATATNPSSWIIKRDSVFNAYDQPRSSYLRKLLQKLESYQGEGARVTRTEFEKLFERREASQVYVNELVKYATPESVKLQNKAHRDYSKVFMQEKRLRAGVEFLRQHETLLKQAQKHYGVARQDIVSILMWESGLGEFTGHFRIFNVFMAQLLFLEFAQQHAVEQMVADGKRNPLKSSKTVKREKKRFKKIKNRAVKSLVALLRQSKTKGIDPLTIKGSWGGAIGYVQFMPYRMNYAVDGDKDGTINLHSWPDAIFSVANYLKDFGNYDMSYKGRKKGIFSYNHNNAYVKGVIAYANIIWKRYKNSNQ